MRIYVFCLALGFVAALVSIGLSGLPAQPLFWAATATASAVPVVRRYPAHGSILLTAIALAEIVLGWSAHVTSLSR